MLEVGKARIEAIDVIVGKSTTSAVPYAGFEGGVKEHTYNASKEIFSLPPVGFHLMVHPVTL
jgi:hypothetical protein